ncbi:MAG: hypothetical protein ACPGRC_00540 [Salibacteraceae bacterium]
MKIQYLLLLIICCSGLSLFSQSKGYKGGFQFKPMLGSGVFSNDAISDKTDSVVIAIKQEFGYSFGMTIRKEFTSVLAVETGLRFTQRNYTANIDSVFSGYTSNLNYRMIGYEIPFKAMVRLKGSDNSYFNVALGGQLDLYPSDVSTYNYEWKMELIRKSWVSGSFLANVGWEIHPVNKGTFYFGLAYNQPFTSPFTALFGGINDSYAAMSIPQNGTFFSLDFRYYFEDKNDTPRR